MRRRIFEIIELSNGEDKLSSLYDGVMLIIIFASLVPLGFKEDIPLFNAIDSFCVTVFILDYLLRLITADYKYNMKSVLSFLRYPFSFMALVDLVSILPSLTLLHSSLKMLRILRMMRAFRVLRIFKALRYSKSIRIIVHVLRSSKDSLVAVGTLAVGYIIVSALVVFNVEPDSFGNYFDALYWATVSLTTVGYGDLYPVTTIGRIVTMVSSLFGIAIVALPAGIITAGYMNAIQKE